ncbi:Pkinase-domain-containing protein [Melanogaster broomeanus]|nr:Pkinase-domain-containing protein [Melanogaster broomeanus]
MNSLQIPDSYPGSSRQHGSSHPVSLSVQPSPVSTPPSASRRQQRASHQVVSSSQQQQQAADDQPLYRDVYSHPAAVAFAAAHPRRSIPKFGPYLLLQTVGEGEFGKVKLGLHSQWGEEVAVKLIRRGNIDTSVRMSKVEREIEVLRTLKHPNIVRLYDVIETDKYIGIILEYASGGELFDHILAHRYLKEKDAAKLFSQLISGVWYIHQKKIVHRDLKLENLLLDRHRNVIITDFGFANRFEHRADDLMQTSCGSPCYAAPELVISEGLYVGSAVDIWSCGVILYAMLAGYLPFDDDPANPDGDNINLLYKYIVNTPLSFPDYISPEARDLLSMMLVPDPTRRADLRSIMAHPWLSAFAHIFSKSVDDLERAAMEQHQMKRLAYQRQMRQTAAAPAEPSRVARTQSARVDGMLNVSTSSGTPRSHSFRDNTATGQPEYLYETSVDQSIYSSSSPPAPSRQAAPVAVSSPTTPDDPFAPSTSVNIPVTISLPGRRSASPCENARYRFASPRQCTRESTNSYGNWKEERTRWLSGILFQVEYPGDPQPQEEGSGFTPGKPKHATSGQRGVSTTCHAQYYSRENISHSPSVEKTATKPLPAAPATPTPSFRIDTAGQGSSAVLRENQPQTPTVAIFPASPPTTANAEDKSFKSVNTGTGSTGSASSRHRKGLSVDKFGLGKIFGINGDQTPTNGLTSRVPSESSAAGMSAVEEKGAPSDVNAPSESLSKNTLLSPTHSSTADANKKSRRNTLTVMVEPFSRSIKSRKGKTPTGETPVKDSRAEKQMPSSSNASPSQSQRQTVFPSMAKDEHQTHDMAASSTKARSVMQWFRRRSSVKPDSDEPAELAASRAGTDFSSQVPTPTSKTTRPKRDALALNLLEIPHSRFPGLAWKFTASAPAKDTTITTRPPPEVIKHVCKVLEEMGMDIKAESEYKYRCVRAKRKKSGVAGGLGFGGVGSGSGLAAFTMVGSAASNGVDKRGLPVPSQSSAGGMLKGLLMRRQSSQVSGVASSQPSLSLDDDSAAAASSPTEQSPSTTAEPVYGDSTQDAGDEVRFSIELTRIDRLKDTYSLDIRRLKGNLRSYKFLYDAIRERADLQR